MRVLMALRHVGKGGATRLSLDLSAGLRANGITTILCAAGSVDHGQPGVADAEISALRRRIHAGNAAQFVVMLLRLVRYERPDVVLSHTMPLNLVVLALRRAGLIRVPIVVVEHSHRSAADRLASEQHRVWGEVRGRILALAMALLYPSAATVVTVSSGVAVDLRARLPRSARIRCIENGIDVERVRAAAAQTTAASHAVAALQGPVIVAAGRLVPEKGFGGLLSAFGLLRASMAQEAREACQLVILGDGPLLGELRTQAQALGVSDAVHFFGFVENPWAVFAQAKVFVLSSRHEGFGLVVAEAVACGLPVVSTDCQSGPAEILKGNARSRLVPVGDPGSMARALADVLEVEALQETSALPAAELPVQFTLAGMADRYEQLLRGVVSGAVPASYGED